MPDSPVSNWFQSRLEAELRARKLRTADLARMLGKGRATVGRWLNGERRPAFDELNHVAEVLGWDLASQPAAIPEPKASRLARARGALEAPKKGRERPVLLCGAVAAGTSSVAFERPVGANLELEFSEGAHDVASLYEDHPAWEFCQPPLFALQIDGDSMAPAYPPGAWLLCARCTRPRDVPSGADVILHELHRPDHFTFKRYLAIRERGRLVRIIGNPLNHAHAVLTLDPKEATIHSLVMGCLAWADRSPYKQAVASQGARRS